jgi:hypothetical protein
MDEVIVAGLKFVVIETGRCVVSLISFGHWRGEARFGEEARTYGPAGALSFIWHGKRIITEIGLQFIGAAFYVVLLVVFVSYVAHV